LQQTVILFASRYIQFVKSDDYGDSFSEEEGWYGMWTDQDNNIAFSEDRASTDSIQYYYEET
jgi:hypothetical protein